MWPWQPDRTRFFARRCIAGAHRAAAHSFERRESWQVQRSAAHVDDAGSRTPALMGISHLIWLANNIDIRTIRAGRNAGLTPEFVIDFRRRMGVRLAMNAIMNRI